MKLTTKQIEELAISIRQLLIDNKLWVDVRIYTEFNAILNRYGLYYELGNHWNLSCYPITPDEDFTQPEPTVGSKDSPIRFYGSLSGGSPVPDKLLEIQQVWKEKSDAYGDVGSCVIGACFSFIYQGVWYQMPPTTCWQGSCAWEHCKDEIEALLKEAGATEITYEWGFMD